MALRSAVRKPSALGETHVDTIVTQHNIAELLIAMGQEERANALQKAMLDKLGYVPPVEKQQ